MAIELLVKEHEERIKKQIEENNKSVSEKIKEHNKSVEFKIKDIKEKVSELLKIDLLEPYNENNLPEWVRQLPTKAKNAWMGAFNSVISDSKDEEKAFKIANSMLEKMGYKKINNKWVLKEFQGLEDQPEIKAEDKAKSANEIMQELINDINAFLDKSKEAIKGKVGSPAIRQFLKEVKEKMKNMFGDIKDEKLKESAEKVLKDIELAESAIQEEVIEITEKKDLKDFDAIDYDYINLSEAKYNDDGEFEKVILIEAGTNEHKMRHYPVETIQEAAPNFRNLKMYINHQTKQEQEQMPERDLRDWVSTITESHAEGGKVVAKVKIHDPWLKERLKDPIARRQIGLSINAGGRISYGKINGKQMQIVEKIEFNKKNGIASVDWVTEPGARGRVYDIYESRRKDLEHMEISANKIKTDFPEVYKELKESILSEVKEDDSLKKKEIELKEAQEKIKALELKDKLSAQKEKVSAWLKEAKIQDVVAERVKDTMDVLFETEQSLKESFDASLKKEMDYFLKLNPKGKINLPNQTSVDIKESAEKELLARFGIKEKK